MSASRGKFSLGVFQPEGRPETTRIATPAHLPETVRGVVFDACNVLYDATLWRHWVLKVLHQLGVQTSYRCLFRGWDRDFAGAVHRGEREFCEAFKAFLRSMGLSDGQIDEIEAACDARRREADQNPRPLPGVPATLAVLHRSGLSLAAVCNCVHTSEALKQRLTRFSIGAFFAAVVTSFDLHSAMPDPVCYRAAIEQLELEPCEVAFVGHDTARLAGAAALGMKTVAFNFDPDAVGDVRIAHFEDLIDVLGARRHYAAAG
jgi:FMN phosphatase YigB (HAD superfamily)